VGLASSFSQTIKIGIVVAFHDVVRSLLAFFVSRVYPSWFVVARLE